MRDKPDLGHSGSLLNESKYWDLSMGVAKNMKENEKLEQL